MTPENQDKFSREKDYLKNFMNIDWVNSQKENEPTDLISERVYYDSLELVKQCSEIGIKTRIVASGNFSVDVYLGKCCKVNIGDYKICAELRYNKEDEFYMKPTYIAEDCWVEDVLPWIILFCLNVKYYAWMSTRSEKELKKNGAVFAGMVRDCPEKFKNLLDKSENRCYIEIRTGE